MGSITLASHCLKGLKTGPFITATLVLGPCLDQPSRMPGCCLSQAGYGGISYTQGSGVSPAHSASWT